MSLLPIKLVDIELSAPLPTFSELSGYGGIQALVRLHGVPISYLELPLIAGGYSIPMLAQAIVEQLPWPIARHLLYDALNATGIPPHLSAAALRNIPHPKHTAPALFVTVAVCTRNRTADLQRCLEALIVLEYPAYEIVVVDNAPDDNTTAEFVRSHYSQIRYVCEPRPGLNWARNRAIEVAQGEIIAFTDDDVVVDACWLSSLVPIFAENPEVMAATGLVVPYSLDTPAEILFERYGGFGRGFERKWYRLTRTGFQGPTYHIRAWVLGTGANMAYRRSVFAQIGCFDPALDVGTATNGGGDLEMFFRVLVEGHTLVYEPAAFVRHRHRRSYEQLRTQITNNGIGFFAFLTRSAWVYSRERGAIFRLASWWFWWWYIRRLCISLVRPHVFPRDLILAELLGALIGPWRYWQARRAIARDVALDRPTSAEVPLALSKPIAIRAIDLSQTITPLVDLEEYRCVWIFVHWNTVQLGRVEIIHAGQPITADRLRQALADQLTLRLPQVSLQYDATAAWQALHKLLLEYLGLPMPVTALPAPALLPLLPASQSVSVVVATRDRPTDLRACLASLIAQRTNREVEIIVVDNHPSSGLTAAVVADFPTVRYLTEPHTGLSYARNTGITASRGAIIVCTDDDVTMPHTWLEYLIAPFADETIMIVTGNVLPLELETQPQYFFELYGGLGRGFERKIYTHSWFTHFRRRAVPTWDIGATANAAFRASLFADPKVGLMEEMLGAGTPTGCSEDTYLFYQALKAGHSIVYEPNAFVWHRHRRDMAALDKQIYSYSKGHVAYHMLTLFRNHDIRAAHRLLIGLPRAHVWQIRRWLRNRNQYPLRLITLEILGNIAGPLALARAAYTHVLAASAGARRAPNRLQRSQK